MHKLDSPWFEVALTCLVLLMLVIPIIGCLGFGLFAGHQECENASEIMDVTVQWRVFGGCFVEIDEGKWIPLSDYHYVQGITP